MNYHSWQLEGQGQDGNEIRQTLWNPDRVAPPLFHWHDVGPKRWNVLTFLLDTLLERHKVEREIEIGIYGERAVDNYVMGLPEVPSSDSSEAVNTVTQETLDMLRDRTGLYPSNSRGLRMLEVGVDTANSTERLLDHYSESELSLHVGIDPYMNKEGSVPPNLGDAAYDHVIKKLKRFGNRQKLLRTFSSNASRELFMTTDVFSSENGNKDPRFQHIRAFDLIFLDALHDGLSVGEDILNWVWKLKPGRILCGHDFQWQYPGLAIAVQTVGIRLKKKIHLASDGMWWIEFF